VKFGSFAVKVFIQVLMMLTAVCVSGAFGETDKREPHLGYLYPAGGQQGCAFEITAAGQYLQGAENAYVSGEGVHAAVIKYIKPLTKKQLQDVRKKMNKLRREKTGNVPARARALQAAKELNRKDANKPDEAEAIELPDHPLLENLEAMSLKELQNLTKELFNPKKQQNMQIADTVIIKISIDPKAQPGQRELRLETATGLTNPMYFEVGTLPEIREPKFNEAEKSSESPIMSPVVLNGQIMPGEVDSFNFRARAGQHLVIQAHARRLNPYLADAVPGWFQAVLNLCDANDNELAWADDYRFDPDPVLYYEITRGGNYKLKIRDAIYRGREDFVYRVTVSEQPFISEMFPLGGQTGMPTVASILGWNLPKRKLPLDTEPGGGNIREAALQQKKWFSNSIPYAVDTLPECNEIEVNDTADHAQLITLPQIINGRIAKSGDADVFRFEGRSGDEIVAEVYARRFGSPLDSLVRLSDASGHLLEWNDDHDDKQMGLQTHYADSYLDVKLPKDGVYYVQLSDAQHHGGKEFGYRLHIGPPRPDFALYLTPSSVNVSAGHSAVVCIHAFRKDGFKGDIEVAIKNAASGFKLTGGHITSGSNRIQMTLTAPDEVLGQPVALQLEGRAMIGGTTVSRQVVPAQDLMQAFAYRHLVPSQELMVSVKQGRKIAPTFEMTDDERVQIPAGGTAQVRVRMAKRPMLRDVQMALSEPPKGIMLQDVTVKSDEVVLVLKADEKLVQGGFKDNLIVEASTEMQRNRPGNKGAGQKQRVWLGALPAIPFEIVQQKN
jgi:hypothetical protein